MKMEIKTEEEIKMMKEGGRILAKILQKLSQEVKPGITTNYLEELAKKLIFSFDAESSFLGFEGFPAVLCVSINEEIVHGIPSERILQEGDVLKLDMGVFYKGFHTDSALTVIVGESRDFPKKELLRVTREALEIGITQAKIGNTTGDIGSTIQKFVRKNGFEVVQDLVGHGIGKELHEPPQVPNFGKPKTGAELFEGMVIAIEPMVVVGKKETKKGKDGFSFVTKDGSLSAHFEHTVAVTKNGPLVLTN
ncbi:MAG: type I methionyl aminopeptidase [Candidatus Yanofskybacteria bacterium CG10_big_fil_rev_8_21_14_0_10_37_15]|uniref:Methionine aminopeptidase n=1 Tax=Candidatus Yanofskybacteria bacterium CG10_big_fil_rev_8_21_14_0_10_37_15 TaxID=1975097 RepID=A0A2H0R7B8_9BACT|nr:MAG: type I methionyl aminopeptidase [Candidatus Yanofskybacteria bacterium CG10_big_fil_rev_8_21_14_0_10_37_15]